MGKIREKGKAKGEKEKERGERRGWIGVNRHELGLVDNDRESVSQSVSQPFHQESSYLLIV